MFLLLVCTLTILIVLHIIKKNTKSRRFYKLAGKIPGPPTYPLIGNSLEAAKCKKGILSYFSDCHKKFGKTVRHWLGSTLYVTITNPNDVEILLRDTKNLSKSQNYDFLQPWLGLGLVTSTGLHWHKHRKILTPAFHFKITEKFVDVFNEKGKILINLLQKHVDKAPFDVYPYINLYALDTIIESAMGIKFQTQENSQTDYVRAVHRITQLAHKRSFSAVLRSQLLFPFTKEGKEQKNVLEILHSACEKVIEQRKIELKQEEKAVINLEESVDDFGVKRRLAFLDLLLQGQKDGNGLTDEDIRDEVDTFMFAGHDTTSSAIAFAVHHLANHPDVQNKAYAEVKALFGDDNQRDITMTDIQNAKYLEQVVKETLRITPPIPFVSRKLEMDLKLSEYTLPAGSSASVLIYNVHRNPEIFPNPEVFDPERFSADNVKNRHPYAFVPFSAGPRNCIGQKYAQLEIKSTLMKLLRTFELLPGTDIANVVAEVVLKSTNGQIITLKQR